MQTESDPEQDQELIETWALDERITSARQAVTDGTPHEWQKRLARKRLSSEMQETDR